MCPLCLTSRGDNEVFFSQLERHKSREATLKTPPNDSSKANNCIALEIWLQGPTTEDPFLFHPFLSGRILITYEGKKILRKFSNEAPSWKGRSMGRAWIQKTSTSDRKKRLVWLPL